MTATQDIQSANDQRSGHSLQRVVSRRWWIWFNRAAPLLQIPMCWKAAHDGDVWWFGFWCVAIWCNGNAWWGKKAANDKVSYHADNAVGAHGKDTNDK